MSNCYHGYMVNNNNINHWEESKYIYTLEVFSPRSMMCLLSSWTSGWDSVFRIASVHSKPNSTKKSAVTARTNNRPQNSFEQAEIYLYNVNLNQEIQWSLSWRTSRRYWQYAHWFVSLIWSDLNHLTWLFGFLLHR